MAKRGIIALLSCIFALSLALVGCGGNAASNKAAFVGTWDLVEMSQEGSVTSADDIKTLKDLGLEVFVNFNDDGTMALVMFGSVLEGTWEAKSATEGTASMQGQDATMTIKDSKLEIEQSGTVLVFEKGEAKEVPAPTSEPEGAADSSAANESTAEDAGAASGDGAAGSAEGEASGSSSASAAA